MKLINIGFGNIVSANRLVAIVSPDSAPIKRIIQDARDRGMLIDASYGRRTRAVIITDSDHIILSAVQPSTVAHRLDSSAEDLLDKEDEDEKAALHPSGSVFSYAKFRQRGGAGVCRLQRQSGGEERRHYGG